MYMKRLIIADASTEFRERIISFLLRKQDTEIVLATGSGRELLTKIETLKPDAVIMNIVLEEFGGISVLSRLGSLTRSIPFIICSDICNERTITLCQKYGARDFLCKPVMPEVIYELICEYTTVIPASVEPSSVSDAFIAKRLSDIGISNSCNGYFMLVSAVKSLLKEPEMISSLSKRLYPSLAGLYNTTSGNVERNIRTAIRSAYMRSKGKSAVSIPTNKQLIAELARDASAGLTLI